MLAFSVGSVESVVNDQTTTRGRIAHVGVEANPLAHFAAAVKADWRPDPHGLIAHAESIARLALGVLDAEGSEDTPAFRSLPRPASTLRSLPPELTSLLLTDSISPLPLHKTLVLLDCLRRRGDGRYQR